MLLSTLIMGAILLTLTVTGFEALFYEYKANTLRENKERALMVATGCLEHALQNLGQSATYQGNESYQVDGETCTILPIETPGGTWIVKTTTTIQRQTARLTVTLSSRAPIAISSWQEGTVF